MPSMNIEAPWPHLVEALKGRPTIALDESSIGTHFRNRAEITDVAQFLQSLQGAQAIGLAGSRTFGRFGYTAEELTVKLLYYGQYDALEVTDEERFHLSTSGNLSRRIIDRVAPLAAWLQEKARSVDDLNRINLRELPHDLVPLVTIDWTNVSNLLPNDIKTQIGYGMPDTVIPVPGAFYPDVDIVVVTDKENWGSIVGTFIGAESGVAIHPSILTQNNVRRPIYKNIINQFRPFAA